MLKQVIALIALSAAIVLFMSYSQQGIQWLVNAHAWVSHLLTNLFSEGEAGNIARALIGLLAIPLLVGLLPAFIYWLAKRNWFPYFMEIVWVVWLVQAGALLMSTQASV